MKVKPTKVTIKTIPISISISIRPNINLIKACQKIKTEINHIAKSHERPLDRVAVLIHYATGQIFIMFQAHVNALDQEDSFENKILHIDWNQFISQ